MAHPDRLPEPEQIRAPSSTIAPPSPWQSMLWDLDSIRSARDGQCRGELRRAAELAEMAKTEPSIFTALLNRIAPHRGLPRQIDAPRARQQRAAMRLFGPGGSALHAGVVADAFEWLAMSGVWIGQASWSPTPDGRALLPFVSTWPIRATRINPLTRGIEAATTQGYEPVVHGDGRWIVVQTHAAEPWQWGAVKPLATAWAQLAYGRADWQTGSEMHGAARVLGVLPPGVPLQGTDGDAMEDLVQQFQGTKASGVVPYGGDVRLVQPQSNMYLVWRELLKYLRTDVISVLLGQDGTVQNEGGNYIKAAQLYGVRNDLVESDLGAVGDGFTTGLLRPWAILNNGPVGADEVRLRWLMPDPDEDARRESLAKRTKAYTDTISGYRAAGFEVTQELADKLAEQYGVERAGLRPDDEAASRPPDGDSAPASQPSQ